MPTTVVIQPSTKDTYVSSYAPDTNYGSETGLIVGHVSGQGFRQAYLYFDLASIPAGSTILSAILELYRGPYQSNDAYAELRRVLADWEENTLTDNNKPSTSSVYDSQGISIAEGWKSFDATTLVSELVAGTYANHGFYIGKNTGTDGNNATLRSREHATAETRPKLTITYNHTPTAPSNLAPYGGIGLNPAIDNVFSWLHNDGDGDPQSAYQLLIKRVSDGATVLDTGKVASAQQYRTIAAGALTAGVEYQWQVKTWDTANAASPYASLVSFYASSTPVATITYPAADNDIVGTSNVELVFEFSDPDTGDNMSAYKVRLLSDADAELYTTGKVSSVSLRTLAIPYSLVDDTYYRAELTLWDSTDTASEVVVRRFYCDVTPPITPVLVATANQAAGKIALVIDNSHANTTIDAAAFTHNGAIVGGNCVIDAQNEYAYASFVATGDPLSIRFFVTDTGLVTDDCKISITDTSNNDIVSETLTCSATIFEHGLSFTGTEGTTYRARVQKMTATTNQLWVDKIIVQSEVLVLTNDIYRKRSGTTAWERIAKDLAPDATYDDYAVASGVTYDYRARAWGENSVLADSSTGSATLTLNGLWLNDAADPVTALQLLLHIAPTKERKQQDITLIKLAGRSLPVVEFGETRSNTLGIERVTLTGTTHKAELEALYDSQATLILRDYRGRKVFGVIGGLDIEDEHYGERIGFDFTAVDYNEGV